MIDTIQKGPCSTVEDMQEVVMTVETEVRNAHGALDALREIRVSSGRVCSQIAEIVQTVGLQRAATNDIAQEFQNIVVVAERTVKTVVDTTNSTRDIEALTASINTTVQQYQI